MYKEELIVGITKVLTVSGDLYIQFDYLDAFYIRKVGLARVAIGALVYMVLMLI